MVVVIVVLIEISAVVFMHCTSCAGGLEPADCSDFWRQKFGRGLGWQAKALATRCSGSRLQLI